MRRLGVGAPASLSCWRSVGSIAARQAPGGVDPAKLLKPGTDQLADLQRRLLRPPLQHADEDQRRQRRRTEPGVDVPAERGPGGSRADQGHAAAWSTA